MHTYTDKTVYKKKTWNEIQRDPVSTLKYIFHMFQEQERQLQRKELLSQSPVKHKACTWPVLSDFPFIPNDESDTKVQRQEFNRHTQDCISDLQESHGHLKDPPQSP